MTRFEFVYTGNKDSFKDEVNALLERGYSLRGIAKVLISKNGYNYYYQSLTKEEEEKDALFD